MEPLAFAIIDKQIDDELITLTLSGFTEELKYGLKMIVQKKPEPKVAGFFEHMVTLESVGEESDNVLEAFSRKLNLPLENKTFPKKLDIYSVFTLEPMGAHPRGMEEKDMAFKGFLGDGSVEFYFDTKLSESIVFIYPRHNYEKVFLKALSVGSATHKK